jgi:hypothetical protein
MFHRFLTLPVLLVGLTASSAAAHPEALSAIDLRYYRAIKPAQSEVRWKQIPWLQNLELAIGQAKKEKRPLFLWATDDEPLERC